MTYLTDTAVLRGLRLTKTTIEFINPCRQVFLLPPHGKHIAAALRDSHKELAFANPLTKSLKKFGKHPTYRNTFANRNKK